MAPGAATTKRPGRSNVTTACTACRSVKIKCDGIEPKCSNCVAKNIDCQYVIGKDKRKLSLKKVIEICQERVTQLEQHILDLGSQIPAPSSPRTGSFLAELLSYSAGESVPPNRAPPHNKPAVPSLDLKESHPTHQESPKVDLPWAAPDSNAESMWLPAASQDVMQMSYDTNFDMPYLSDYAAQPPEDTLNLLWDTSHEDTFLQSLMTADSGFGNVPEMVTHASRPSNDVGATVDDRAVTTDDDDDDAVSSDNEIIEQLSTRLGSLYLAQDGNLKYLGATSNMTLSRNLPFHDGLIRQRPLKQSWKLRDAPELDATIYSYLEDVYFHWQDPFLHVVDREMFEQGKTKVQNAETSSFCSEALKYAIASIGAVIDPILLRESSSSAAQTFADHAEYLLELEYDQPNVATVQALAVLSCYELTRTRDTRGWLYAGMASRLALDLGLHVDGTVQVQAGTMTIDVARARRATFQGTYVVDQLWTFYLGRPLSSTISSISASMHQSIPDQDASIVWNPINAAKLPTNGSVPDSPPALLSYWLTKLCSEISLLALKMYGPGHVSNDELMESAEKTFHGMLRWKASLPLPLRFDVSDHQEVPTPHVLFLHVQYHAFIIILHRPFVSKHENQPYPPRGEGPFHARKMCIESAVAIARIMTVYADRYGLSFAATSAVHPVFTAALILIYATLSETNRQKHGELSDCLATLCNTLSELGNRFLNASRALDALLA